MKKVLSLIMAVGLSFGLCFASVNGLNKIYADDYTINDDSDSSFYEEDPYTKNLDHFAIFPQIILNQETGCYDIDIYIASTNQYFSNFEADLKFLFEDKNMGLSSTKISIKQYVNGNFTANMKDGVLSMVFNATKNIDLSKGLTKGFDQDRISAYCLKAFTIKTDIKYTNISKGFYLQNGEIRSAGVMRLDEFGKEVRYFEECEVENEWRVVLGDYDFDGMITINDLVAAQYYLVNHVSFSDMILDAMLNSICLQYLQMYLCDIMSYYEYADQIFHVVEPYNMLPYKRCDRYWDYEYWEGKTFTTDAQGYKYLGADKYGNYHIWNDSLGYKFFIEPKEKNSYYGKLWTYEIKEDGKMVNSGIGHVSNWGDLYMIYGTENQFEYIGGAFKILNTWDEDYWSAQTPNAEEDESSGNWEYKGKDVFGNKHYWGENGFKFFTDPDGITGFRYLIDPVDNKILIIAVMEKILTVM